MDGWDPADNPALEHLNHVPHCGWAININIEQRNQDPNRMEEDPLSEKMMEARRATFKDAWPHDGKKGWKCKLEKVKAKKNSQSNVKLTLSRWWQQDGVSPRYQKPMIVFSVSIVGYL